MCEPVDGVLYDGVDPLAAVRAEHRRQLAVMLPRRGLGFGQMQMGGDKFG